MAEVETITAIKFSSLARILAENREQLNARFNAAKFRYPHLEGPPFLALLGKILPPVTAAMTEAGCSEEEIRPTVLQLYHRFLELMCKGFLGNRQKYPLLEESLTALLTRLPQLLAAQPQRFSGALINGLVHLMEIPGSRPLEWVNLLLRLGKMNPSLENFLDAGKVAAWRCGLAQYRLSALELCHHLPPSLVHTALDLPATRPLVIPVVTLVNALKANPWLHPQTAVDNLQVLPNNLKLFYKETGAFSGFGGTFLTPPQVVQLFSPDGGFVVKDASRCFLLFADLFGHVLLPIEATQYQIVLDEESHNSFTLDSQGLLKKEGSSFLLPQLSGSSSFIANNHSFCASFPLSHTLIFGGLIYQETIE